MTRIDPDERRVYIAESPIRPAEADSLEYDYLVVVAGVVFDGSQVKGYSEHGWKTLSVYEPGRLDLLKARIWSEKSGSIVVYAPPMPYRCAPAPAETALLIHTIPQV